MRHAVVWLVIAALFGYWYHNHSGRSVPSALPSGIFAGLELSPSDAPDTCFGKMRCVVVYVAPWCPVCHAAIGFIKEAAHVADQNINAGIKVVIGNDEPQKIRRMAEQIGLPAYLDDRGTFGEKMGVEAFPTWIITDRNGNVVRRFASGAPQLPEYEKDDALKAFFAGYGVEF
jgi:hypothetical protein